MVRFVEPTEVGLKHQDQDDNLGIQMFCHILSLNSQEFWMRTKIGSIHMIIRVAQSQPELVVLIRCS